MTKELPVHSLDTVGLVPGTNGESLADAIDAALRDASLSASDIDAAIPYGCGVPAIDAIEADALHRVFGARAATLPLVTLAPFIGATVAGFGAIAVSVAAKCITEQRLPARLNSASTAGVAATAFSTTAGFADSGAAAFAGAAAWPGAISATTWPIFTSWPSATLM